MPNFEGTMTGDDVSVQQVSECSVYCQCGEGISLTVNAIVHQLAKYARQWPGVEDVIPAYNSLLIRFREPGIYEAAVRQNLSSWSGAKPITRRFPGIEIPVCFHPSLANNLTELSAKLNLEETEITDRFCAPLYTVYMLGFLPGFPYLGTLHESLQLPRRSETRIMKAGAVAIAGAQAGIYPTQSPGGWHVLGYTPFRMFDASKTPPSRLEPGQQVKFVAIPLDDYRQMQEVGT